MNRDWITKGVVSEISYWKDGTKYHAFVRGNKYTIFICRSNNASAGINVNQHILASGICKNHMECIAKVEDILGMDGSPIKVSPIKPAAEIKAAKEAVEEKAEAPVVEAPVVEETPVVEEPKVEEVIAEAPVAEGAPVEKVEEVQLSTVKAEYTEEGLVLTCDVPNSVIRYTTNNKTVRNSHKSYKGPLNLEPGTPLRAAAFVGPDIVTTQFRLTIGD